MSNIEDQKLREALENLDKTVKLKIDELRSQNQKIGHELAEARAQKEEIIHKYKTLEEEYQKIRNSSQSIINAMEIDLKNIKKIINS